MMLGGWCIQMTEGGPTTDLDDLMQGQVLEERQETPQGQPVSAQYVWSPVYVNASGAVRRPI